MIDYDGLSVDIKFQGSNQLGRSALHLACEKGHYECAKILLQYGANTEAQVDPILKMNGNIIYILWLQ